MALSKEELNKRLRETHKQINAVADDMPFLELPDYLVHWHGIMNRLLAEAGEVVELGIQLVNVKEDKDG